MTTPSKKPLPKWTRMSADLLIPDPEIRSYIASAHDHIANGLVNEHGEDFPKYGVLSLEAQRIPVLAYGSKHLKDTFPNSFNDGNSIFISDSLAKSIAIEEAASQGERQGITPLVMLHEIHIVLNHGHRLDAFPDKVAQIAGETSCYSKLKMGFPDMKWAQCVESGIPASTLPKRAIERYSRLAEETIAKEILAQCKRVCPAEAGHPSDETLKTALASMGFKPELCAHPTCKDQHAITRALALDQQDQISRAMVDQPTLLHIAAERGDASAVGALLPISDPHARDASGRTALRIAAEAGHEQAARLLLPASKPSALGRDGLSASEAARRNGHGQVADLIDSHALSHMTQGRDESGKAQQRSTGRRL